MTYLLWLASQALPVYSQSIPRINSEIDKRNAERSIHKNIEESGRARLEAVDLPGG